MLRPSPLQPCRRVSYVRHLSPHCETRIHDTPYPSGGHRLVGPAWVSDLNRLRELQAPAFGTFRWADSLRLGRIEPLSLAWWCDRLRPNPATPMCSGERGLRDADIALLMDAATPLAADTWLMTDADVAREITRRKRKIPADRALTRREGSGR